MFMRIKALVTASDPEPVMFLSASALVLFGSTLLWPGMSFSVPSFAVLAQIINEDFAGAIILAVGLLTLVSLLRGNGFMRFMCVVMVALHTFLATIFVLSGLNSTGNTYFIYAAGAAWSSWRLVFRK